MKIKNKVTVLLVSFILVSCMAEIPVVPTKTAIPTSTIAPVLTATSAPTYVYLPTITPVPSTTPFLILTNFPPTLESEQPQARYDSGIIVIVKSEAFLSDLHRNFTYKYEVVLNLNNSSGKEFKDVNFLLVTYQNKDAKNFADILDNLVTYLGGNETTKDIPVGISDMIVDIPIHDDQYYLNCNNGNFDKPLYLLLFSVGNTDTPLTASSSLNQKILEMPCK